MATATEAKKSFKFIPFVFCIISVKVFYKKTQAMYLDLNIIIIPFYSSLKRTLGEAYQTSYRNNPLRH